YRADEPARAERASRGWLGYSRSRRFHDFPRSRGKRRRTRRRHAPSHDRGPRSRQRKNHRPRQRHADARCSCRLRSERRRGNGRRALAPLSLDRGKHAPQSGPSEAAVVAGPRRRVSGGERQEQRGHGCLSSVLRRPRPWSEGAAMSTAWLPTLACIALLVFLLAWRIPAGRAPRNSLAKLALLSGVEPLWGETSASL